MVGQNILLTVSNLPLKIPVNSVTFGIADGQSATWRVSNNQGTPVVTFEFFALNTRLQMLLMLASKAFNSKIKLPLVGLDLMITGLRI